MAMMPMMNGENEGMEQEQEQGMDMCEGCAQLMQRMDALEQRVAQLGGPQQQAPAPRPQPQMGGAPPKRGPIYGG